MQDVVTIDHQTEGYTVAYVTHTNEDGSLTQTAHGIPEGQPHALEDCPCEPLTSFHDGGDTLDVMYKHRTYDDSKIGS